MTGVELTAESCVLVEVRRRKGATRLDAIHLVEPAEWPPHRLARVRRRKRFSRRAVVISWSADGAGLEPLIEAGFTIEAVLTPEDALGRLALEHSRDQDTAVAWLALSRAGAAIAIVHGSHILYSRRIHWVYKSPARLHDQLLQRYTLVSHLAPEIEHGIQVVRSRHGIAVGGAVTCGDFPDLRSLTMPLIEELDLEVETLDSLEGVDVAASALADGAAEYAPALRLASAATAVVPDAPRSTRWWGRAAAAVLVVGIGGWWAFSPAPAGRASRPDPRVGIPVPAATSGEAAAEPAVVPLIPPPSTRKARPAADPPEPLPSVTSILFGPERRFAILDGSIVGEGDAVGNRRVVRIEREAVVLRDTAGGQVRVPVRRGKQQLQP
jgi:hypothetical protein